MQRYFITQTDRLDENGDSYIAYGIRRDGFAVDDISFNKAQLEGLISAMNDLELACEQALSVIEDFVSCPIGFINKVQ